MPQDKAATQSHQNVPLQKSAPEAPPVLCGVIYFTSVYMTQFAAVNGTFQDLSIVLTCLSYKHLKTVESFMTPWKEQEKESSEVSDCFTYIAKDTSHQ